MIATDGVYIELRSDAPERLATFYERLVGLARTTGPGVVLAGAGVTLAIKPSLGEASEDGGAVFGFRVPNGADPSAVRAAAIAGGAVVLSESKRDGIATLSCQDPDGNAFVIVAMLPSVGIETAPVLAAAPVAEPKPVTTPPVASQSSAVPQSPSTPASRKIR